MNKTSKQVYPSVGMARPHWLCCQSALELYFCPVLSHYFFLSRSFSVWVVYGCYHQHLCSSHTQTPKAPCHQILFSLSPCYIPHIIPSFPTSIRHLSSLCHPHISYRFVSWGERWGPNHNWVQCPSLYVSVCVCVCESKVTFSVSACLCVCVHVLLWWYFHHADAGCDGYPSFLLHWGQHFSPAPHSRECSDRLIVIGFWFASKWGVAAS